MSCQARATSQQRTALDSPALHDSANVVTPGRSDSACPAIPERSDFPSEVQPCRNDCPRKPTSRLSDWPRRRLLSLLPRSPQVSATAPAKAPQPEATAPVVSMRLGSLSSAPYNTTVRPTTGHCPATGLANTLQLVATAHRPSTRANTTRRLPRTPPSTKRLSWSRTSRAHATVPANRDPALTTWRPRSMPHAPQRLAATCQPASERRGNTSDRVPTRSDKSPRPKSQPANATSLA